jgi:hypothetical protein
LAVALDRFGFHVNGLANLAWVGGMRISFPDHVRGEREGTVVGERGKPGILRWASADLNEKCAEQEPRRQRERPGQPWSAGKKP